MIPSVRKHDSLHGSKEPGFVSAQSAWKSCLNLFRTGPQFWSEGELKVFRPHVVKLPGDLNVDKLEVGPRCP